MLRFARHPVLVMADSDMRAAPDYLTDVVAELQAPGTGLVTCLYKGVAVGKSLRTRLHSALGSAFINFGFLPSVLIAGLVGADTGCFGASIALRRETLEAVGGFPALADQLADDYVLGRLVRKLGLKVTISSHVVANVLMETDLASLFAHELRWQRTIRSVTPAGLAASAVTNPVALALLSLPVQGGSASAWALLAAALAARWALVRAGSRWLGLAPLPLALLPLRDALSLLILAASFCGQRVTWRGHAFQVDQRGMLRLEGQPLA
jgi:ceramide glucosyltransferase